MPSAAPLLDGVFLGRLHEPNVRKTEPCGRAPHSPAQGSNGLDGRDARTARANAEQGCLYGVRRDTQRSANTELSTEAVVEVGLSARNTSD